jgi:hypothetical protein
MGKWKKLIPVIAVCLIAGLTISYFAFGQNTGSTVPSLPPAQGGITPTEPEIDSDGDGFSDQFEENIASYDPNVSNDRYFIYCEYLPEEEKESNIKFSLTWQILVDENKVPSKNIIRLAGEKATRSNLQEAIEEIAAKADDNDIVFVRLLGHGGYNSIACCCDGNILYSVFDEWLDKIRAKVVISQISGCKSECAAEILKDGLCPRIVLTGGFSMEGFYNKETADKYPWMTTYADYGYNNPAPALDYNDIFFGFADKMENRDGYVSLGEFIKVLKTDVEARWHQEEWNKITDYPWWDAVQDESGIADRIYLIEHSPKENIFWEIFHGFND